MPVAGLCHAAIVFAFLGGAVVLVRRPMDKKKEQPGAVPGRGFRNKQQTAGTVRSIQVKHPPLECVPIISVPNRRGAPLVIPGQIAHQLPEFPSAPLLINYRTRPGSRGCNLLPAAALVTSPTQAKAADPSETHAGSHKTLIFHIARALIFKFVHSRVNAAEYRRPRCWIQRPSETRKIRANERVNLLSLPAEPSATESAAFARRVEKGVALNADSQIAKRLGAWVDGSSSVLATAFSLSMRRSRDNGESLSANARGLVVDPPSRNSPCNK